MMPHKHIHKEQPTRRIERSGPGRISFRPGKQHPLDVQLKEAQKAKQQLDEQLTLLAETLQNLTPLQQLSDRIEAEDKAMRDFLAEHYKDYFHRDHLEATFLWLRRRRVTARLQAAQTALSLAQELLSPDPFIDQLQDLVGEHTTEEANVDQTQFTGHPQTVRDHLANYETRLQEIRTAITRGNGWIEAFFVKKQGFKPEIIKLAYALYWEQEKGTPVPPEMLEAVPPEITECLRQHKAIPRRLKDEATTETSYGPYYKYRWREGNSPIYTISLGRLSERPDGLLPFHHSVRFSRE